MKKTKSLLLPDEEENYHHIDIVVVEEKTDEPIGNFTGLFNQYGQPLFRPKERIGFKWK